MAQSLATGKDQVAAGAHAPEYSIYIYHHPSNHLEGWNDWEKRSVTQDLKEAMQEAESLFASQEFEKVEIKEKRFDARKDHLVDRTLKIYEDYKVDFDVQLLRAALMCGLVLVAAYAFVNIIKLGF